MNICYRDRLIEYVYYGDKRIRKVFAGDKQVFGIDKEALGSSYWLYRNNLVFASEIYYDVIAENIKNAMYFHNDYGISCVVYIGRDNGELFVYYDDPVYKSFGPGWDQVDFCYFTSAGDFEYVIGKYNNSYSLVEVYLASSTEYKVSFSVPIEKTVVKIVTGPNKNPWILTPSGEVFEICSFSELGIDYVLIASNVKDVFRDGYYIDEANVYHCIDIDDGPVSWAFDLQYTVCPTRPNLLLTEEKTVYEVAIGSDGPFYWDYFQYNKNKNVDQVTGSLVLAGEAVYPAPGCTGPEYGYNLGELSANTIAEIQGGYIIDTRGAAYAPGVGSEFVKILFPED